jgi:hypothetical protein
MTFDVAIVVAAVILFTTFTVTIVVVTRRRVAAQDEEQRQQASMRGWTFLRAREGRFRVQRWTGTTDGVAWIAESVESSQSGTQGRAAAGRRRVTRWKTSSSWTPPTGASLAAPIVVMGVPEGQGKLPLPPAEGGGWIVTLAQKAVSFAIDKAIDHYFGEEAGREIDAGALQRVKGDSTPGYVVMAADPAAAARLLFQGLSAALTNGSTNSSSVLSDKERPSILLWNKGIVVARMDHASSAEQIERYARAGVTLVRQLSAGRPSPS